MKKQRFISIYLQESFLQLQNSKNPETLTSSWENMNIKCESKPNLLLYLEETWLVHKERFVTVEEAHATIKRCLKVSTMDPRYVRAKLTNCLQQQEREFRTAIAAAETRFYRDLNDRNYHGVVRKVSFFALRKIKDEIKEGLAGNRAGTCTHAFERTYGLPCWHSLSKKIDNAQTLLPSDIHSNGNFLQKTNQQSQGMLKKIQRLVL